MTAFGIDRLRDGQPEIITTALEGESLLAVLPTGAGKSACFQLPATLNSTASTTPGHAPGARTLG
jgi:ATP-dependent DNA helicase RecQ